MEFAWPLESVWTCCVGSGLCALWNSVFLIRLDVYSCNTISYLDTPLLCFLDVLVDVHCQCSRRHNAVKNIKLYKYTSTSTSFLPHSLIAMPSPIFPRRFALNGRTAGVLVRTRGEKE